MARLLQNSKNINKNKAASIVQDAEDSATELVGNVGVVDEIVSLGTASHLEKNEGDVEELAEEYALTAENLEKSIGSGQGQER